MRTGNGWLCLGPILFLTMDMGLTLFGQPAAYWQGDREQVQELMPYGQWLLRRHPLLLAANALAWVVVFSAVILLLPAGFAKIVSFVIQVGHTLAAASWLIQLAPGTYVTALAFLLLSVKVMDWTWQRQERAAACRLASGSVGKQIVVGRAGMQEHTEPPVDF